MKRKAVEFSRFCSILCVVSVWVGRSSMAAIEEASYTVEQSDGTGEVRLYAPHVVAETVVEGSLTDAGNRAFRLLFNYISGENRSREKIAMTAPVGQERPAGEKIPMTAPVGQQAVGRAWAVTFMMPGSYTLETLPQPLDERVRLRAVPARRMAAMRYSGRWTQRGYEEHLARLRAWMVKQGMAEAGEPVWARYNPPFTPWFMRRNEILIPIP